MDEYVVENGRIMSPGKFEGKPEYAPYFYDLYLNGDYYEAVGDDIIFNINAEDRKRFPVLAERAEVILRFDDQGFISVLLWGNV